MATDRFVILAYGDPSVVDWVKKTFPEYLSSGKIRLASIDKQQLRVSYSKNVSHRLATGAVVCNLDADNIMAPGYAKWLGEKFSFSKNYVVRGFTETEENRQSIIGTGGRIAMLPATFDSIGGYDETYSAWGREDGDIVRRAIKSGAKFAVAPDDLLGIVLQHSDEERYAAMTESDKIEFPKRIKEVKEKRQKGGPILNTAPSIPANLPIIANIVNSDGISVCPSSRPCLLKRDRLHSPVTSLFGCDFAETSCNGESANAADGSFQDGRSLG